MIGIDVFWTNKFQQAGRRYSLKHTHEFHVSEEEFAHAVKGNFSQMLYDLVAKAFPQHDPVDITWKESYRSVHERNTKSNANSVEAEQETTRLVEF